MLPRTQVIIQELHLAFLDTVRRIRAEVLGRVAKWALTHLGLPRTTVKTKEVHRGRPVRIYTEIHVVSEESLNYDRAHTEDRVKRELANRMVDKILADNSMVIRKYESYKQFAEVWEAKLIVIV